MTSNRENEAARTTFRGSIDTLLKQRGIDPKRIARRNEEVVIEISSVLSTFEPSLIDPAVQDFINSKYPGRNLGVAILGASYNQAVISVADPDEPATTSVDLEKETVQSNSIYLNLQSDPMQYGITDYSFREWIKGTLSPTDVNSGPLNPKVIFGLAKLIPDPAKEKIRTPQTMQVVDIEGTPAWKRFFGFYNVVGELMALNMPEPGDWLQKRIIIS